MLSISDAAESLGLSTAGIKTTFSQLAQKSLPCIVQWKKDHFVVLFEINNQDVVIGDPAIGIIKYKHKAFKDCWCVADDFSKGFALILEPTDSFYEQKEEESRRYFTFGRLFSYLNPHKKLLAQLFLSLLIGSLVNLVFPYLTQSVVDVGIANSDLSFIVTILLAQLCLVLGAAANRFFSSWLLLHIGSRLSITIVDDFLGKLMKLPIGFFNRKRVGDLLQRIGDFDRIQRFLTTVCISMTLAVIGFLVYCVLLYNYGSKLFLAYLFGGALYILWTVSLLKKRKQIDYKRFQQLAKNQNNMLQLINGMEEIKLNCCENSKREEWQNVQLDIYKINASGLSLEQLQSAGAILINNIKNLCITFLAARGVVSGTMTIGVMMAIQYLIGQMDGPLGQAVDFLRSLQDTKISMERANEVEMEGDEDLSFVGKAAVTTNEDLVMSSVSFQYNGPRSPFALKDVSLTIKSNCVTAIVGESGSGKTTIMRLLLGILTPTSGDLSLGNRPLNDFDLRQWRKNVGVVMQDGFIFTDTIKNNIALFDDSSEHIDEDRIRKAASIACIDSFIEQLPLGYETVIGPEGVGLSAGQKQRILIARAIYKDAPLLFLDEATNALDTTNEKQIMNNLSAFYQSKTVVIIAHRLSTVKTADHIIVLSKGQIVEEGTHASLVQKRGHYYNLVKNQLELGV